MSQAKTARHFCILLPGRVPLASMSTYIESGDLAPIR